MQIIRHALVCCLLVSGAQALRAQEETVAEPPFSERTGIKGITVFFGAMVQENEMFYNGSFFKERRISPQMVDDFYRDMDNQSHVLNNWNMRKMVQPVFRAELVLAPFRLSRHSWKRNMEWTHGLMVQEQNGKVDFTGVVQVDPTTQERYLRVYRYYLSQATYQTNLLYHFPVAGNTMLYTGVGAGVGIPYNSYFRSSPGVTSIYRKNNGSYDKIGERAEVEGVRYNEANWNSLLHAAVGFKVHITCRINIHGEYALAWTHHYLSNGYALPDLRHGLLLGVRYKFNRPPKDDTEKPEDEVKPFW